MAINRRNFIRNLGASAVTTAAYLSNPACFTAHAATNSGYKALVSVFFLGGLDGHDVLLPYDPTSYNDFARIRQTMLSRQGASRQRANLTPLSPVTDTVLAGRQIALPPEMPYLKTLFDQGDAAIVGNVGPLLEPVNRATFESGAARLPPRLFSHNDQQATWQASAPEGAQFGWGGLFADAALTAGANQSGPQFTSITTEEFGPFLNGRVASPYQMSVESPAQLNILEELLEPGLSAERRDFLEAVRRTFGAGSYRQNHILGRDMAAALKGGLATNDTFNEARKNVTAFTTAFPGSPLGAQLKAIAETISIRDSLFASRQIFFVGMGGFDTHSGQATALPALLGQIDGALSAFHQAMSELGLSNDVTLFTASDFGRSLVVNGDGTDHGWGGHQIVLGGGVNGGEIYGSIPPAAVGHEADSGNGRIIPSVAVEEYAAQLGRWFGLSSEEVNSALPNLSNFSGRNLNFMQVL